MGLPKYAYIQFKDDSFNEVIVLVDHVEQISVRPNGGLAIGLRSGQSFEISDKKEAESVLGIIKAILHGDPVAEL